MKKPLSFLLAVFLILAATMSFSACGSTHTAVSRAIAKTAALDSYRANLTVTVSTPADTAPLRTVKVDMVAENARSDMPEMSAVATVTTVDKTERAEVYQAGAWFYISANDLQYKANTTAFTDTYHYTADLKGILQELPEELFGTVTGLSGDDGTDTYTLYPSVEQFSNIFGDFTADMHKYLGEDPGSEADACTVTDATVSVTVKDGYVIAYKLTVSADVSIAEEISAVTLEAAVNFISPGTSITADPPYGYQNYPEYAAS